MGSSHGKKPPNPLGAPKVWGKKPPAPPAHGGGRSVCDRYGLLAGALEGLVWCMDHWRKGAVLGALVLALSCGGNQHTDQDGKTNCTNAGGRPVPCEKVSSLR